MSRWMIAVRGTGFVFAVPLAIFTTWDLVTTSLYASGTNIHADIALICCGCAALLLLNATLLSSSVTLGVARSFIAHVVLAPPVAFLCYMGSVDPVALFLGLPLLGGIIVMLGAASCPLRRLARSH